MWLSNSKSDALKKGILFFKNNIYPTNKGIFRFSKHRYQMCLNTYPKKDFLLLNHIIMSHLACLKIALFKVRKV
jgi:hypothetical protein